MPSQEFFELLAACIKEDGAEAIQASLENVPGPSNEEFFGEKILEGMKKEIRKKLEEKARVSFEETTTYEKCSEVSIGIQSYYHCNDNYQELMLAA